MTSDGKKPVEASFMQFVGGMAMQTLVHLGKMSNPLNNETKIDLPNAKYSIDLLSILQDKTKGNLTSEESEHLANLLRDLRMEYVSVVGKADRGAGDNAAPPLPPTES